MPGGEGDEVFALRGGARARLGADALVVRRAEEQRLPYRAIRAVSAVDQGGGDPAHVVSCGTDGFPVALAFPDGATRDRFVAALRARVARAQAGDA